MKKFTVIIAASLLMFSCTKELSVREISSHIKSTEQVGDRTRYTYEGSDIVVYEKKEGDNSVLEIQREGESEFIKAHEEKKEGVTKLEVRKMTGELIYSLKVNERGQVGYFTVREEGQLTLPITAFQRCMLSAVSQCNATWSCTLICGAAIAPCTLGWSMACAAQLLNNSIYN